MSGWSDLGAFFGGGGNTDRARDAGISDAARMEAAILKARQARDAEVARNTAVDRLVASGVPRNVAQRLGLYMRAGVNPEQYSGAQEDYQHINQGNELFQQAGQPDTDLGAFFRRGQVYSGDFAPATKVSGGVAYSPSATPGAQTIKATPVGLSEIAENMGLGQSGGTDQPNFTAPSSAALLAVLGGKPQPYADPVIDPQQYQNFLRWQSDMAQTDPRFADGDFALSQYAAYLKQHQPPPPPSPPADLDAIGHQGVDLPFGSGPGDQALPYTPQTQAEFDALPVGAYFIDPQSGKLFQKQ